MDSLSSMLTLLVALRMSKVHILLLLLLNCLRDTEGTVASRASVVSQKRIVIVGGGPVGLYFAALMKHKDPTAEIHIFEKKAAGTINAFGLGVSERMQNRLTDVPGLKEQAISISSTVESLGIPLVSRDDLTQQMSRFLLDNTNCKLTTGESCESVDFDRRQITTSNGRNIQYDLLLAADGVNSRIRRQLVEQHGFQEEHYLEDINWKALKLPKQSDLTTGSFKPLQHPSIRGGRVLPKAPEGHILLLFWKPNGSDNPNGIDSTEDLKLMITEGLNDKKKMRMNPVRKIVGLEKGDSVKKDRILTFDEAALKECFNARVGRVHHLQIPKYHYQNSVALIGDSAHSFNSLLGQGCATGFESAHTLVESLTSSSNLSEALSTYTRVASAEAHAMTELSLISYALSPANILMALKVFSLILWNMMRGRGFLKHIRDITVPFSKIAAENRCLLKICRLQFEKQRLLFTGFPKPQASPAGNPL